MLVQALLKGRAQLVVEKRKSAPAKYNFLLGNSDRLRIESLTIVMIDSLLSYLPHFLIFGMKLGFVWSIKTNKNLKD